MDERDSERLIIESAEHAEALERLVDRARASGGRNDLKIAWRRGAWSVRYRDRQRVIARAEHARLDVAAWLVTVALNSPGARARDPA